MSVEDKAAGTRETFAVKLTADASGIVYQERVPTIHLFPEKPKPSPDNSNYWGSW